VLIIPLVIAIVIVLSAAILSQRAAYTRSKASFDPVQACVDTCNKDYRKNVIKDPAACALDCPAVVAGDMTCKDFCKENVKAFSPTRLNPTQQARVDAGGQYPGTISACKATCGTWVANPCSATGAVCKDAIGAKKNEAKAQCNTSCELVKNEANTCAEVMTVASLSAVKREMVAKVRSNCQNYFE